MKIAIAGAGLAGVTLSFILKRQAIDFEIYDIPSTLHCGLRTPCGFGVNKKDFLKICRLLGLNGYEYILREDKIGWLDNVGVATNLATIDKPLLVKDLLGTTEVRYDQPEGYDLLIDASGVNRAYSEAPEYDLRVLCRQSRVKLSRAVSPHMMFSSDVGYAWLIPLNREGTEAHLGAGALKSDGLQATINNLIERVKVKIGEVICSCGTWIRATGPILPMVNTNIITIGEAAGLVSPLSGGGNIPAMLSAFSLASHLDNPSQYQKEMLRRFGYFRTESEALRSLSRGRVITPRNIIAMLRMLKFVGIHPTTGQYWRIIQTIKRRLAKPRKR